MADRKTPSIAKSDLECVRDWAIAKIQEGNEPPWSWYQLMKLREALEAILTGMAVTQPMEDSQGSASRRGAGLRLVGSDDQQDSAQCHPAPSSVLLPM